MPRQLPPGERRDRQLLLRFTATQLDWLESAAFLDRVTANEYVFDLVCRHVDALMTSGPVRKAHDLRGEYDAGHAAASKLPPREASREADDAAGEETVSGP